MPGSPSTTGVVGAALGGRQRRRRCRRVGGGNGTRPRHCRTPSCTRRERQGQREGRGTGRACRACPHPARPNTGTHSSAPVRGTMRRGRATHCCGRRPTGSRRSAARTTPGDWRLGGLLASRPEVIAHRDGRRTEHVAEARAAPAAWITALSPAVAPHRWPRGCGPRPTTPTSSPPPWRSPGSCSSDCRRLGAARTTRSMRVAASASSRTARGCPSRPVTPSPVKFDSASCSSVSPSVRVSPAAG